MNNKYSIKEITKDSNNFEDIFEDIMKIEVECFKREDVCNETFWKHCFGISSEDPNEYSYLVGSSFIYGIFLEGCKLVSVALVIDMSSAYELDHKLFYISSIATSKEYRNKGFARILLKYIKNNFKDCFISLHCRESNEVACKLYMSEGFDVDGLEEGIYMDELAKYMLLWNT